MKTVKSVLWTRMVLAFSAVLLVGGSSLCLAAGPGTHASPISSYIIGPNKVVVGSVTPYYYMVTFNDGVTGYFPPETGVVFTSIPAGAMPLNGLLTFTAPAAPQRAKITATYTHNSITTSASKFIFVQ